ncbi:TetR/AcrR family transcriptional regulator [Novosphingobium sp. 9U]|uniref:TetR/AcrR family transcriptional regulator n=1 Tax=Novosphingobium sp. 9U TaxID=2653158 RepID=UPI0012F0C0B1|nr:TetR/AcrR family transcriptional regulator [Novosphingobium sp. 9U]VWX46656.1 Transcriptional regulator [Novosphingobium sp. 9U]
MQDAEATGDLSVRRRPGRPSLSNEELLDKALDLFLEKGFDGTSIDAITAAAGMAKRTVYARYGDKTRLFKAALSRAIDEWMVPVENLRALEAADLEQSLVRIGDALVGNVLQPAGLRLMRLTNAESVRMPEISIENVRLGTEPTLTYLADLFTRRMDLEPGQAMEAAHAFLNLIVAGPANSAAWGLDLDMAAVTRQTRFGVQLFLHGLSQSQASDGAADAGLIDEAARLLDDARERLERLRATS